MWRSGVVLVLLTLIAISSAGFHYGAPLQRLKRSPGYGNDCPPYFPQPYHHRHWPPFGPPPFGPPHFGPPRFGPPQFGQGPPNWEQDENSMTQDQGFAGSQAKSQALTDGKGNGEQSSGPPQENSEEPKPPCEKCGKNHNAAVSNASSGTGSAIAIAISGKNTR